jgi:uncharacterized protein (AIM24 family)
MSDQAASYTCKWCRRSSDPAGTTCPACGAPVDVRQVTTDSGWTQLPAIPDMTRIQFGQSTCQIEGAYVPAADMKLAAGDSVYFSHHVLLWQDPAVALSTLPLKGAWNRHLAGMPLVMMQAAGPGHIAFSRDAPGELMAVPLQAGTAIDVRENHFLVATSPVAYDWYETGVWFTTSGEKQRSGGLGGGLGGGMKLLKMGMELASFDVENLGGDGDRGGGGGETEWHFPLGRYMDRFHTPTVPGLLLLHAAGNVFVRTLAAGETIMVKPPALLFKDPTVGMQLHVEYPQAGMKFWRSWGNRYLWLRMWGPGRVAVQSAYEKLEDPGSSFQSISDHSEYRW